MDKKYIEIDLTQEEKWAVLKYAEFFIMDKTTKADLSNKRKKWIRFASNDLPNVIGELSHYFNHCKNDDLFYLLDELIGHLENHEERV